MAGSRQSFRSYYCTTVIDVELLSVNEEKGSSRALLFALLADLIIL